MNRLYRRILRELSQWHECCIRSLAGETIGDLINELPYEFGDIHRIPPELWDRVVSPKRR